VSQTWAEPDAIDFSDDDDVAEVSGLVASPTTPELLWLHNDSGDVARLVAVTTSGTVLGSVLLPEVTAIDFEDAAVAPCPDGSGPCLWIADTGDNLADDPALARTSLNLLAIPEPVVDVSAPFGERVADNVWSFPFTVQGGPANIEAVVVTTSGDAAVLFEKRADDARILRLPLSLAAAGTMGEATISGRFDTPGNTVALRVATGADLHVDGRQLLLRTYEAVYLADLDDGVAVDGVLATDFVRLYAPLEAQGEVVSFDADGTGIWTSSEQVTVQGFTLPNRLRHAACQ
jgi:hypothetical protein